MADIAALASLDSLARLELGDNDIVDIGPLAGLADLATLGLAGNAIEDVGALASLDKLVWLSLDDNNLSDLAPLSALTELAALRASFNELADIAPLADLKSLQRLMLHDNRISDLSALAGLADLVVLWLGENGVADVSALADLAELRQLILAGNDIRDVSPLAGLTKLRILTLGDNQVADIGPLAGLRDMRVLDLEYNEISELGDVGRLKNLSVLDLENNDIADIGSLVDNPGMGPGDLVDLRQNPLDALALGHVEDLRARGVRVLADGPDLVTESASVSDATPDAGASLTLSATVRNAGAGASAATTLRYYRSDDAVIDAADTEVGTDAVPALDAGAESAESIVLTAPSSAGTYYYGACADSVSGESDTANNCSDGVEVEVEDSGGGTGDDHGDSFATATSVAVPSTTDGELEEGGDKDYFRFEVATAGTLTVETAGSTDTYGTLFDSDQTSLERDDDDGPGRNFKIERDVAAGTYYVEARGFSTRTTGTYELSVEFADGGGGGSPDLVAESVSVSDSSPDPGASFTLDATVRNAGDGDAVATTLRYYRSDDAAISTADTEVGTDAVFGLAAGASSAESISLTAPTDAGTYYYGGCVDSVSGESGTSNNCSQGVAVTVSATPVARCEVELDRAADAGGTETVSFMPSDAQSAEVGTSNVLERVDAELDSATDFDVFEVSPGADGWLTVVSGGSLDTQAVFLADDCTTVEDITYVQDAGTLPGVNTSNLNFVLAGDVQSGTYYVVVFEWAGGTGDYALALLFDDPLVNDAPVIRSIAEQEIAVGDTATVVPGISDDRGDTHTVTATSDNAAVATVAVTEAQDGDSVIVITAVAEGTATVTVGADDQHGASAAPATFDVEVTTPTLAAPTVEPGDGPGELKVTLTATLDAGETRAFDYHVRRKKPQGPWDFVGCARFRNGGSGQVTARATTTVGGRSPGVVYEVRYRDRRAAACDEGTPTQWSAVGRGASGSAVAYSRSFDLDAANGAPRGLRTGMARCTWSTGPTRKCTATEPTATACHRLTSTWIRRTTIPGESFTPRAEFTSPTARTKRSTPTKRTGAASRPQTSTSTRRLLRTESRTPKAGSTS